MPQIEQQQRILGLLKSLRGLDQLKTLFWSELNYERVNRDITRAGWSEDLTELLVEDPILLAAAGPDRDIQVIYCRLSSERLSLTSERQVISRLLQNRPYALFVFSNESQDNWHFVNVKETDERRNQRVLRRITVGPDERLRTASERIALLDLEQIPESLRLPLEIQQQHDKAFDVQPVTNEFYREYDRVFKRVEAEIQGFGSSESEQERKRLFTQRLFNRLMFLAFIQKKGWLKFDGQTDYLEALWKDYKKEDTEPKNFYSGRLKWLFFSGLSTSSEVNIIGINRGGFLKTFIGDVPYLNGGLFEEGPDDRDTNIILPDTATDKILHELFEHYNFTVTESTPLDQEVAVDPEMLGKVFEELVTGRNETGSYYTPKPIVSFMCKESLKGYLGDRYTALVDEHEAANIDVPEARDLLARLGNVRVIDPACGSGAYLLGMLHELHALTRLLDTRVEKKSARDDYNRKLQVIQNNLYGVDNDEFAVQIARLRLWLSLAVEHQGPEPEPLPNLDYKIECDDSLTAPSPQPHGQVDLRMEAIRQFGEAKARFLTAHHGDKLTLRQEVERLREDVASWTHEGAIKVSGFDWAVEFAEVFAVIEGKGGGFDIVLANPPYGASVEDRVRDLYFDRRTEGTQSKEIYGLFIARGLQLLAGGGQLCYIVSDTWRTIKTHKPLRKRILEQTTVKHVLDLPAWIFDATVNTCILTLAKQPAAEGHQMTAADLRGIASDEWETLTNNLLAVAEQGMDVQTTAYARYTYPQELIASYDNHSFFIGSPRLYELMSDERFTKLDEIADVKQGLATADNQYYLRKRTGARGSYQILNESKLLTEEQIANLTESEKREGINPKKYSGRHFLPYDKGGESDSDEGWLPNYNVPTQYFIDWSRSLSEKHFDTQHIVVVANTMSISC
jgi:type I restriction-modification system DNA methylase subunit